MLHNVSAPVQNIYTHKLDMFFKSLKCSKEKICKGRLQVNVTN